MLGAGDACAARVATVSKRNPPVWVENSGGFDEGGAGFETIPPAQLIDPAQGRSQIRAQGWHAGRRRRDLRQAAYGAAFSFRGAALTSRRPWSIAMARNPRDLDDRMAARRRQAKADDGFERETFPQPRDRARLTVMAYLDRWPATLFLAYQN